MSKRQCKTSTKLRVLWRFCLNCEGSYVLNNLYMTRCNSIVSDIICGSYGTYVLDHLAADGAGFPGGQVAVVAVGQVDAHFPWCPFYILNSPNTGTVEGI